MFYRHRWEGLLFQFHCNWSSVFASAESCQVPTSLSSFRSHCHDRRHTHSACPFGFRSRYRLDRGFSFAMPVSYAKDITHWILMKSDQRALWSPYTSPRVSLRSYAQHLAPWLPVDAGGRRHRHQTNQKYPTFHRCSQVHLLSQPLRHTTTTSAQARTYTHT